MRGAAIITATLAIPEVRRGGGDTQRELFLLASRVRNWCWLYRISGVSQTKIMDETTTMVGFCCWFRDEKTRQPLRSQSPGLQPSCCRPLTFSSSCASLQQQTTM